jgi:hypothetical protein
MPDVSPLVSLVRMCYESGKPAFLAGGAACALAHVVAMGGFTADVSAQDLPPASRIGDAASALRGAPPGPPFLDAATGDVFQYVDGEEAWVPVFNSGVRKISQASARQGMNLAVAARGKLSEETREEGRIFFFSRFSFY